MESELCGAPRPAPQPAGACEHPRWGTNPGGTGAAWAFTSNSTENLPRPTQHPCQPPDLNPGPTVVRRSGLQASGPHTSPRAQSISLRAMKLVLVAQLLHCAQQVVRWRSAPGLSRLCNTRDASTPGKEPSSPLQDSALQSSAPRQLGPDSNPPRRAGGMTAPCWVCQALCRSCPMGTAGAMERWRWLHSGSFPGSCTFWGPTSMGRGLSAPSFQD